jgi:hypothetical protein
MRSASALGVAVVLAQFELRPAPRLLGELRGKLVFADVFDHAPIKIVFQIIQLADFLQADIKSPE